MHQVSLVTALWAQKVGPGAGLALGGAVPEVLLGLSSGSAQAAGRSERRSWETPGVIPGSEFLPELVDQGGSSCLPPSAQSRSTARVPARPAQHSCSAGMP